MGGKDERRRGTYQVACDSWSPMCTLCCRASLCTPLVRVEVYAKRIDRRIVPARGACGVSSEGTHGRRGTRRVRTEDEGVVTGNIEAPLAQIMVHLHREHR